MCEITGGISQSCEYSVGGLSNIYLANTSEVSSITQSASGEITAVTMSGSAVFYEYEFVKNSGVFNEESNFDGDNNRYFLQNVSFNISRKDQTKNNQMELLGLSTLTAICKTKSGEAFLVGWPNGLQATVLNTGAGGGPDDPNGYQVSLAEVQVQLADEVDTTIISGLL